MLKQEIRKRMNTDWQLQKLLQMMNPEKRGINLVEEFRLKQLQLFLWGMLVTIILAVSAFLGKIFGLIQDRDCVWIIFLSGIVISVLLAFLPESRLKKQCKEKQEQLSFSYPEFVNQFILLMGAGLTVRGALKKIISGMQERQKREGKRNYLLRELQITYTEMENGISETVALERLGNRTGLISYIRFGALLSQNLKKGSDCLLPLLEVEAAESFSKRKEKAKQAGEEASTKMLLPMMMMFAIVLAIIIIPAFQQI